MKKSLLFVLFFGLFVSFESMSQPCGQVSLIGEFNTWAGDHFMTRNPESPELFTTVIGFTDADSGGDGIVELKFRANADWTTNWGSSEFPSGTGVQNGDNIPVPVGTYKVTFNCSTGAYNFITTCGEISMIGEFNQWAGDAAMTRDMDNQDEWKAFVTFTDDQSGGDGIVEMKFRQNADWTVNWGSGEFPSGTGVQNGDNIPVPVGSYMVTFNCATGAYNFTTTCGEISIIGEFNAWAGDLMMNRNMTNPNEWTVLLTLTADMEQGDPNGIIELKFRQNMDWGVNWGSSEFPSGTGVQNGDNIPVPLDETGLTTDYWVTFNCSTGAYTFQACSGAISMIGGFNNWNGDVPMNRDMANPNLWKLSRSWYADFEVKFRENKDWSVNWGNNTFPSGVGTPNGPNIPLVAGKYDVTFNATTAEYNFVTNNSICGEIGLIGDFNSWGDDGSGTPTDVWLERDPVYPSNFSLLYNFTSSTDLWFRLDADITYTNVWGGTFPSGQGVLGGDYLHVPGGKYFITYNCKSNDFNFQRLGNGVSAPKVFAINVDGLLNETDWKVDNVISQIVDGAVNPAGDLNTAYFGVAYNDTYLYVGLNVTDGFLRPNEQGEVFIDGNKSGGPYDEYDLHMKFSGAGIEVIQGPAGITPILGFIPNATGYTAEVAIPWADLQVVPEEGGQIGFDILLGDDDTGAGVDYVLAWNGGLQDYDNTSSFGDLIFGTLSCGQVSVFNDVVGDVQLRNPTGQPTTYVGSYELFENQDLMFRKDFNSTVSWAADAFPAGTATLEGPAIPAQLGRYRISFDCLTGAFTFTNEPAGAGVAYSEYTDSPVTIDGDLSEYTLSYNSAILTEGVDDNTVTWGSRWDMDNLYLGVHVVDAIVSGANTGSPWTNDAIEYYIDGNHDRDGTYDSNFDTQLIQDFANATLYDTALWLKADGVQLTNWSAKWVNTSDGYSCELRLGWDGFQFLPGKGRSIGFSLGNDDNNGGTDRTGQSVWYGDGNNWSNTGILGDLQLAGGPYFFNVGEVVDYSNEIVMYPNPAATNVYLRINSEVFKGNVTIHISDLTGRNVVNGQYTVDGKGSLIQFDASQFTPGIYIVNILGNNNVSAVKKLIVR